jgi:hypothetical protein
MGICEVASLERTAGQISTADGNQARLLATAVAVPAFTAGVGCLLWAAIFAGAGEQLRYAGVGAILLFAAAGLSHFMTNDIEKIRRR